MIRQWIIADSCLKLGRISRPRTSSDRWLQILDPWNRGKITEKRRANPIAVRSNRFLKFNSINLRIFLWRTNVYLWFIFDIWWWFVKKFDSFTLDHESFSNLFTKEGGQRSPRFIRLEFEIHREESLDYSIKYRDVMIHIESTVIYRAVCRGNQYTAISTGRVSTDGRVPNFNQRTGTIFEETRFFSRQRLRKRFN